MSSNQNADWEQIDFYIEGEFGYEFNVGDVVIVDYGYTDPDGYSTTNPGTYITWWSDNGTLDYADDFQLTSGWNANRYKLTESEVGTNIYATMGFYDGQEHWENDNNGGRVFPEVLPSNDNTATIFAGISSQASIFLDGPTVGKPQVLDYEFYDPDGTTTSVPYFWWFSSPTKIGYDTNGDYIRDSFSEEVMPWVYLDSSLNDGVLVYDFIFENGLQTAPNLVDAGFGKNQYVPTESDVGNYIYAYAGFYDDLGNWESSGQYYQGSTITHWDFSSDDPAIELGYPRPENSIFLHYGVGDIAVADFEFTPLNLELYEWINENEVNNPIFGGLSLMMNLQLLRRLIIPE